MKTTDILENLRSERAALAPAAARDLEPLRASLSAARSAELEYLNSPERPTHSSAPDVRALELNGAITLARQELATATGAQSDALRRIAAIDLLLTADATASTAADELAAIRTEGAGLEQRIADAGAAIARFTDEGIALTAKAIESEDALAERALRGEAFTSTKGPSPDAEIARLRSTIAGLQRKHAGMLAELATLTGKAAAARHSLLNARRQQAELAYQAALLEFAPVAAALEAASRVCGRGFSAECHVRLDPTAIDAAAAALDAEATAWRPSLAVAESTAAVDTACDAIEADRQAA